MHYSMPGTLEAYYQEAGRAGRDGLPARAILFYSPKDTALHEFFIEKAFPSPNELRVLHNYITRRCTSVPVKGINTITLHLDELAEATNIPSVKTRIGLEKLEATGAVTRDPNMAGNLIRVRSGTLTTKKIHQIDRQFNILRQHKLNMLSKMVNYAETNECRRLVILRHFGDTSPADAPVCCDNCEARKEEEIVSRPATTQSERAALIVLDTINRMQWSVGKRKIALILKGSKAKEVARYTDHRNFGKFSALRIGEIESLIDQLVESGYIKAIGSRLPTLALTTQGSMALKSRSAIQVELRPVQRKEIARIKAEQQAGSTLALTFSLLESGLTPQQIAAERGFTENTIYSHLARLISEGSVDINAVVSKEHQQLIHQAIDEVGSIEYLSPIKARLPESIDYGPIRCVVEAWKIEHTKVSPPSDQTEQPSPLSEADQAALYELLRTWRLGKARSSKMAPFIIFSNEVLRRIASSCPQSNEELLSIHGIGNVKSQHYGEDVLSIVKRYLKSRKVENVALQKDRSLIDEQTSGEPFDPATSFLSRPHPRPLKGPWLAGWALDFHSRFDGDEQIYTKIGDLVKRYKYQSEHQLVKELAQRWMDLLNEHKELPQPEIILPIPPSTPREFDPVEHLAQVLASLMKITARSDILAKSRITRQQKELKSLAAKQNNIKGAFSLRGDVDGRHLLLVDDLFDSGATLSEAARTLSRGRPASIVVLTLTKTIHADL